MAFVDADDLAATLTRGFDAPVVLVAGDDTEKRRQAVAALEALVPDEDRAFNVERFHLTDPSALHADQPDLLQAALLAVRQLSFMGGRRFVTVLHFDEIFKQIRKKRGAGAGSDEDDGDEAVDAPEAPPESASTGTIGALEAYLKAPVAENTLILEARTVDRGTRLGKLVVEHALVVDCSGVPAAGFGARGQQDARRGAERYVLDILREQGLRVARGALDPLLDHAGSDTDALRQAAERIALFCEGRGEVARRDVEAVVGGATSIDPWAITTALSNGDLATALRELQLAVESGTSPYQILGQLGWWARERMPRGRAAAAEAVFRADTALKSSGGDPLVLLERLVVELAAAMAARRGPRR
ncbi:MAG: hypothetical protein KJ061_03895 [Vicinamibacteraceae bacterium]|nr:hypothetical protein [Vicinamibacteraceae bacterium]